MDSGQEKKPSGGQQVTNTGFNNTHSNTDKDAQISELETALLRERKRSEDLALALARVQSRMTEGKVDAAVPPPLRRRLSLTARCRSFASGVLNNLAANILTPLVTTLLVLQWSHLMAWYRTHQATVWTVGFVAAYMGVVLWMLFLLARRIVRARERAKAGGMVAVCAVQFLYSAALTFGGFMDLVFNGFDPHGIGGRFSSGEAFAIMVIGGLGMLYNCVRAGYDVSRRNGRWPSRREMHSELIAAASKL